MHMFSDATLLLSLACLVVEAVVVGVLIWLFLYIFNSKLTRKFKRKKSRKGKLISYVALLLAVAVALIIPGNQFWWISSILVGLSFLLYLFIYRKGSVQLKIFWLYTAAVFFVLSLASAFFVITALPDLAIPGVDEVPQATLLALSTLPLFALMSFLLSRQKQRLLEPSLNAVLITALIPTLSCVILALFIPEANIWGVKTTNTMVSNLELGGAALLFTLNAVVLVVHDYFFVKTKAGLDEQTLLRESELRRIHYEELQSLYDATRTWRHDYANHLQAIEGLVHSQNYQELSRYVSELKGSLDEINFRIKSGIALLDAFLNTKASYAESLGIDFEVSIETDINEVPVSATEITSLIGNLTDNAIESCQRVEDKSVVPITQIRIARSKSQFVLYVKNTLGGTLEFNENGKLQTSKREGDHGIGTRQIDAIVKKHKGLIDRSINEGMFETFVVLPLASKERA